MKNYMKTIISALQSWVLSKMPKKLSELENDLPAHSWENLEEKPFCESLGDELITISLKRDGSDSYASYDISVLDDMRDICNSHKEIVLSVNGEKYTLSYVMHGDDVTESYNMYNGEEVLLCNYQQDIFEFYFKPLGLANNGDETCEITLYEPNTIKTLDEKYIPDTVARTTYVDENFALKSDLQNIDLSSLETKDDAIAKLTEAKEYADTKVSGLASTSDVTSTISGHNASADAHSDIREVLNAVKEDVDTFFKDATLSEEAKDTLKEIQDYITGDASAAAEMTASIANKADKVHTHVISDVSGLQDALDVNNEAIEGLTETIENVKEDAANQAVIVLSEAQKGIDANTDRIEALETAVSNKVDTEHTHSWNDLEDKPFYCNKKVLLNITSEKTNYNSDTETIDLVVGEKYNVLFKDMLFRDVVCQEYSDGIKYIQDPNFFHVNDQGGAGLQISGGVYSSYTIEVYQEELKKLDDLFLEQSDWNNNDEYSGTYIKNRPFYNIDPVYEEVSDEITVDVNTAWYGSNYYVKMTPGLGEKFRLSLQDVCTVVWDGIEYKDIQVQLFRDGRYPMTAIGNNCYETPLFTTYPFSIGYSSNNFNTELWVCAREAGTHTFQIFLQTVKPELKQLDEKYIPDSIARVEYVDEAISNIDSVTSWNDLEDKPFYTAGTIEQTLFEFEDVYNSGSLEVTLKENENYIVTFDDVKYECLARNTADNYIYIGNQALSGGISFPETIESNEPFYIEMENGNEGQYYINISDEEAHNIKVSVLVEDVVKIDSKYLHNADWNQNDENAPGYIKNRPFYEVESYVSDTIYDGTIPAEDITEYKGTYSVAWEKRPVPTSDLVGGTWYEVVFNGTTYNVLCRPEYYPIMGDVNLETYPFNMYYQSGAISIDCKEPGSITLKISIIEPAKIVQLDSKYIPFVSLSNSNVLSWDGNTNGLDVYYDDNRFYKISNQVLTEQDVQNGGRVIYSDGEVFDFTADDISSWSDDSGLIISLNYDAYLTRNGIYLKRISDSYYVVSLEINGFDRFVVETIKPSYINAYTREESDVKYQLKITETIDWEQNDKSAINYIKNRTHYKEIGELTTLVDKTISTKGALTYGKNDTTFYVNNEDLPSEIKFDLNKVYVVTFDDERYVLIPGNEYSKTYIGNSKYVATNYNEEDSYIPFVIYNYNNQTILNASYGDHTVKIEEGDFVYHQLDEKYIPDTIARVEDLNNIDLSSYQSKEDDNLTTTDKTVIGAINEVNEKAATQSDWNENDETSSKFIKNRTHYALLNKDYNLEQTKFALTNPGSNGGYFESLSIPLLKPLTIDTEYIVVWDGVQYPITITSTGSMGSLYWSGAPIEVHSGEPFFVGFGVDNGESIIAIIMGEGQGDHTIEIYTGQEEVVQLDEKFIPDTILRKGDQIGQKVDGKVGAEIFNDYLNNKATKDYAHAEGENTTAFGYASHAEGSNTTASGLGSHAEGYHTKTSGDCSHAEGNLTKALEYASHAEGYYTIASGLSSHAEGGRSDKDRKDVPEFILSKEDYPKFSSDVEIVSTKASGIQSHAEGFQTYAYGYNAHSEGFRTVAFGDNSHSQGKNTVAYSDNQHAEGRYNIFDFDNKYIHIAGNGESDDTRSNAHTLDWDGNACFAGNVYVGSADKTTGKELVTKEYVDEKLGDIEALLASI